MTRRLTNVRRLLVIAPHPDDEAIAAWELIRRVRARSGDVTVVVVSDGGASHPGSRAWPRDRLVAERRRETRRVLRLLGIAPSAIRFLDLPDGSLPHHRDLPGRLRRAVLRQRSPEVIVAPVAEDAHADHAAVAAALRRVPRRGEMRLGYHVWPEGACRHRRGPSVRLSPQAVAMKRAAIRRYRTQAGRITDAEAGFTLNHRHLRVFAAPVERFGRTA